MWVDPVALDHVLNNGGLCFMGSATSVSAGYVIGKRVVI